MSKGICAPPPHHTTTGAVAPMAMVHIDTAGPYQQSVRGSRYVAMFMDSASRFQRPYGARGRSTSAFLGVVKCFVAGIGVLRAVRTDNGAECTNVTFVDYCNSLGIHRELTASYTPH